MKLKDQRLWWTLKDQTVAGQWGLGDRSKDKSGGRGQHPGPGGLCGQGPEASAIGGWAPSNLGRQPAPISSSLSPRLSKAGQHLAETCLLVFTERVTKTKGHVQLQTLWLPAQENWEARCCHQFGWGLGWAERQAVWKGFYFLESALRCSPATAAWLASYPAWQWSREKEEAFESHHRMGKDCAGSQAAWRVLGRAEAFEACHRSGKNPARSRGTQVAWQVHRHPHQSGSLAGKCTCASTPTHREVLLQPEKTVWTVWNQQGQGFCWWWWWFFFFL